MAGSVSPPENSLSATPPEYSDGEAQLIVGSPGAGRTLEPESPQLKKIADLHAERYRDFTDKASDVGRHLAFAGIAVVWIFRHQESAAVVIPRGLALPLWLFIWALAFDLAHYVAGVFIAFFRMDAMTRRQLGPLRATVLGLLHRYPPARILFMAKCASLVSGYALLLIYLWGILQLA